MKLPANIKFLIIRVGVILLGVLTAIVIYSYIFRPLVLEPLCLVDSNGCVRMGYYSYNNSALIHMRNTGIWLWYNGDSVFIYGQPVGQLCQDPSNYVATYEVDPVTGMKKGYKCVMTLNKVLDFYNSKGVKMKYIVKRVADVNNFSVYDVLNILNSENIINSS